MSEFTRKVRDVALRQERHIQSFTAAYEDELRAIVSRAQAGTIGDLVKDLDIDTEGVIANTAANQAKLRTIGTKFRTLLNKGGFERTTKGFVQGFDGQLPFFEEILESLSGNMKTPLSMPDWSDADVRAFGSFRLSAVNSITSAVEGAGDAAVRRAMFSTGGLQFGSLVDTISREFGRSISEASGIGGTAMATYYRTITARGYDIIAEGLDEEKVRFLYEGPLDNLTRPWCAKIMTQSRNGRRWTKKQIMAMVSQADRGKSQPPNVFTTCGGWACRHQWVMAPIKP